MDVENCENCKARAGKEPESVPYIVHEASMARMERQAKRVWIAVLVLILLMVGTNAVWLYYENQWGAAARHTLVSLLHFFPECAAGGTVPPTFPTPFFL